MSIIKNLFITGIGFFAGMAAQKNAHDPYEQHHCHCHDKENLPSKVHSYMDRCKNSARVQPAFKFSGFDKVIETEIGTLTIKSDAAEIIVEGVVNNSHRFSQFPIEASNSSSWMNKASEAIKQGLKDNGIDPKSFRIEWSPKNHETGKPDEGTSANNDVSAIPSKSEQNCSIPSGEETNKEDGRDAKMDARETEPVAKCEEKHAHTVDQRDHSSITVSDIKAD